MRIEVEHLTKSFDGQRPVLNDICFDDEVTSLAVIGFSGGQQQRIAIAPEPKLLLLDEPTSALDPEYTVEVLNMIDELCRIGLRFIIVTHEMGFAHRACDKAAFLSGGRLPEYGESYQLFAAPRTPELQQFLGKLLEWNN